ncbi:MAG TPA: carbamoyltransferase HypF, partial [Polyangia bacterium]
MRFGLRIRGTVQGVGFRPALYRVAATLGLAGMVRNDDQGVWVEIEGTANQVQRFGAALSDAVPALARVDAVEVHALDARGDETFAIGATTTSAAARARIPPDVAPCDDCLRELFDPRDRRHRYPFINCTACGPRYTIIQGLPYDRSRTTMASFAMCARCRREYLDPGDRRFHAEPNACPACGPRLSFVAPGAPRRHGDAALAAAVERLQKGAIVALRGVGGFLLAVDARDAAAVARLRERKRRPHKPLALMARDLAEAERVAVVDGAAARALASPARPIVLLPARPGHDVAPAVAPGLTELGLMLPSTPLHHLLFADGPPLLVMTSGNASDEPLARDNDEAALRLGDIADAFVEHDRPIHTRVDDSVVRIVAGEPQPMRRARGLVPEPIALPFAGGCVLAVGGELKSTVCATRGADAFVSQHLGDLSPPSTFALFEETIAKLERLYDLAPTAIAHDLHPDYRSTRWALAQPLPRVPVQHHHAHIASCLAEHGRLERVIGVAFDGTGCGPAGELWGGEFLVADLGGFRRVGHLRALRLAGGEAAIRQPWRLAAAALLDAGEPLDLLARCDARRLDAARRLLATDALAPPATSAGRWFDAVAALVGVRDEISYEGQAAVELEALAGDTDGAPLPFCVALGDPFAVDLRPAVRALATALAAGTPPRLLAASFHETLAAVVVDACDRVRARTRLDTVALSGGCFQNVRLTTRCRALLSAAGFTVLVHRRVPPNDGGLAL